MIKIKTKQMIDAMREAGRIAGGALCEGGRAVRPGITTGELDRIIRKYIEHAGAKPSFLHYNGYPASACISVNDQVIHGIPGSRELKNGDIVSIDVGAKYKGFHGDCANTFAVGDVSDEAKRLIAVTRESFFAGIRNAKIGMRISDISNAVQQYAEQYGFYVVRDYVGHGVGEELHEAPEVPNYGAPGHGARLLAGMTIAVEPMINETTEKVNTLSDGWTVVTKDGGLSAHYEHTVLITSGEPELLTATEDMIK